MVKTEINPHRTLISDQVVVVGKNTEKNHIWPILSILQYEKNKS